MRESGTGRNRAGYLCLLIAVILLALAVCAGPVSAGCGSSEVTYSSTQLITNWKLMGTHDGNTWYRTVINNPTTSVIDLYVAFPQPVTGSSGASGSSSDNVPAGSGQYSYKSPDSYTVVSDLPSEKDIASRLAFTVALFSDVQFTKQREKLSGKVCTSSSSGNTADGTGQGCGSMPFAGIKFVSKDMGTIETSDVRWQDQVTASRLNELGSFSGLFFRPGVKVEW